MRTKTQTKNGDTALECLFIDRMDQNEEIIAKYLNEENFKDIVTKMLQRQVYDQINSETAG